MFRLLDLSVSVHSITEPFLYSVYDVSFTYVVHMCTIMLFTSVLLCCVSIYDVHFVVLVWAAAI